MRTVAGFALIALVVAVMFAMMAADIGLLAALATSVFAIVLAAMLVLGIYLVAK